MLPDIVAELRPWARCRSSRPGDPLRGGEGLRPRPDRGARVRDRLDINVSLISQAPPASTSTFVVEEAPGAEAVLRLHEALFEREPAI